MDDPFRRPALTPRVFYRDPCAALDFLEQASGFNRGMVITDKDGRLGHCELRFGVSLIDPGAEWTHDIAPASIGARAAGRVIRQEPADQFCGDRAHDPQRDVWTFGQAVRVVSREDAERASALKIEGRH